MTRFDLVEAMARGMFDCYRGYNDETQRSLWIMSKSQLERQAERALAAIHAAGYAVVPRTAAKAINVARAAGCGMVMSVDDYEYYVSSADLAAEKEG